MSKAITATNSTAQQVARGPQYEIMLRIKGLKAIPGEDGLFSIVSSDTPASIDGSRIIESLKEQGVKDRVIDQALDALYGALHTAFVTDLFAERTSYLGSERL